MFRLELCHSGLALPRGLRGDPESNVPTRNSIKSSPFLSLLTSPKKDATPGPAAAEPGVRDPHPRLVQLAPDVGHMSQLGVDHREGEVVNADVGLGDVVGDFLTSHHEDETVVDRLQVALGSTDDIEGFVVALDLDDAVLADLDELLVHRMVLHPLLALEISGGLIQLVLVVLAVVVAGLEDVEGDELIQDFVLGLEVERERGCRPVLAIFAQVDGVPEDVGVVQETRRDHARGGDIDFDDFSGGDRQQVDVFALDVDLAGLDLAHHRDGVGQGGLAGLVIRVGVVAVVADLAVGEVGGGSPAAAQQGGQNQDAHGALLTHGLPTTPFPALTGWVGWCCLRYVFWLLTSACAAGDA